ncbi:MAG: patatin-like phospholipase family protein [Planctomycetota bacterium]|jgi:hypothetical protein
MKLRILLTSAFFASTGLLLLGATGCSLSRNPIPIAQMDEAEPVLLKGIRTWGAQYKPDVSDKILESLDCSFLCLSGGGANGAFGAGFLCGWTESGKRPDFAIVTGISTGALIAPLAFAGPQYDDLLREGYTTTETKEILELSGLFGIRGLLFGESFASTKPLEKLIAHQVDEKTLEIIAAEYKEGRRLYIGTTHLDAQRFVVWDMGKIAASGHPKALDLFHKIMLASASIPGAFPPVYFNVEAGGKKYDEMHADGGTITEVFGYGPELFAEEGGRGTDKSVCSIYVIRNGKLASEPKQIQRKFLKIAERSFATLMKAHSWNDLIRMYSEAERDGVDFNYVSIPDDYEGHGDEPFDPEEMTRLFNMGFEMAKPGYEWQKEIPYFKEDDTDLFWTPSP